MNNHTTIRGSTTSHNMELIKRHSSLGPEEHEPHYCKHFARVINPTSIQDCAVLCWWFILFLRLQPVKEHGNTLCLLLYILENMYHSLAIKCLSPYSSYTALTREKKSVKFASFLQQKKALGFSKRNVQRCTVLPYQKPFFSSTEWKIYYLSNVTFVCIRVSFPALLKKAINYRSNSGKAYDSILPHKRKW